LRYNTDDSGVPQMKNETKPVDALSEAEAKAELERLLEKSAAMTRPIIPRTRRLSRMRTMTR
jgi:hypothetical protein